MPTLSEPPPSFARRGPAEYQRHKSRMAARSRELSHAGADVGAIPPIADLALRQACERSLETFCTTAFPKVFYLPFSPDHIEVIGRVEETARRGGQYAEAMPRGSGKTSLLGLAAPLWVALNGLRCYLALIAATWPKARRILENIKQELRFNDVLLALYPEVIWPVRRLNGVAQRAHSQHHLGSPTGIEWGRDQVVLPTIGGSSASGTILQVAALLGDIRGLQFETADGRMLRPDFELIDDPQTDESAKSATQTAQRLELITGACLNLGGPDKRIAALMACTVIQPGDVADQVLDPKQHPEWHGRRHKLLYSMPTNLKLWDEYAQMRAEEMRNGGRGVQATHFYALNQPQMDAGARVAWEHRKLKGELTAIQHAMNKRFDLGEATFLAEYQNEPPGNPLLEHALKPDDVMTRVNGLDRGLIHREATILTAHVDIHDHLLYWLVAAWRADNYTGWIVDYGTFPDQQRAYFTLRDATRTLGRTFPGTGVEGAIYAGLKQLLTDLLAREWRRVEGGFQHVNLLLVDAGYVPTVVYAVLRELRLAALLPARGVGIKAVDKPLSEYKKKPGETIGFHWYLPSVTGTRELRHARVDANHWKSFVHKRLAVAKGDPGALTLFGQTAIEHRLLADHVTRSEYATPVSARGRTVNEWKPFPNNPDNHWLDNLVGAAAAASMAGARLREVTPTTGQPAGGRRRRSVSYG